ncbi:MAG: response regulator [Dinghuibacter sp.]|nr:response regulator [Dinghuibacter sp.]
MKTRSLIWLITIASCILFLILSLVFKWVTGSKNDLLLREGFSNLRQETEKVYSIKTSGIEQFIFDNSYWDELVTAIHQRDTQWVKRQVGETVKNFNVNVFWLLNARGELVYFSDLNGHPDSLFRVFDAQTLVKTLQQKPFRTFHVPYAGKILQLTTAPIQPGSDQARITPHQGYYIGGRYFDSSFAAQLNQLAEQTRFGITGTALPDTIQKKKNLLHYYFPLKGFTGQPVAYIRAEKSMGFIGAYTGYLNTYFWIYLALMGLLLFGFYQFLRIRVLKPLARLSVALNTSDASGLKYLESRKDEFSDVAQLLEDSFQKNILLQKEVEARKESEAALKQSATELEKATVEKIRAEQDRLAKAEFLSTMSHEIRTPINGVIGIANLLKDEPLSEQQSKLVNTLIFSSNHLLSILTDILDLSKIEAGNIKFDHISFSLKEVCNSVHNLYAAKAKEKNLELFMLTDNRLSGYLLGDSVRLCQVLNNIISNAIKFTDTGSVTFSYRMLRDEPLKQTIEFTIQDTGIGIPADKMETIFESFSQANRTINSNYGGTGLGLTITKKLIELQGGKISVSSKPGKGSVFTFFLTFNKVATDPEQPILLLKNQKNAPLSGLKVLIAEDNKINALVLGKFLEKWQVDMQVVVNGREALNKLEQEHFDLVLMDLHMPVMDGMEATQQIRKNASETVKNIPVIALTADATSETQKQVLENGFNHYLSKPFNPDNLYRVLEKYR